jgi:hypothetical protein
VISIDLNPTGNLLATGSGDNLARICAYLYFPLSSSGLADAQQGATLLLNVSSFTTSSLSGIYLTMHTYITHPIALFMCIYPAIHAPRICFFFFHA